MRFSFSSSVQRFAVCFLCITFFLVTDLMQGVAQTPTPSPSSVQHFKSGEGVAVEKDENGKARKMMSPETIIKLTTAIVALAGAFLAAFKFLDEKRRANETAKVEARKPFTTRQQEIYLELVNVTSIISTRYGEADWEPAFNRFWTMFWGVIPIVADEQVSVAIDRFADTLDHLDDPVPIRNASMNLARACRRSLGDSWDVRFEHYKRSKRAETE